MVDEYSAAEPVRTQFSNELLSSLEVFEARTRSHKIPVKGEKDFLPTESKQQVVHLHNTLDEHWTLVAEERLERIGNLVNAEWISEMRLVKLLSPAGKFWQTMGFSNQGNQYLFPEEALYLMECGTVQVFYQDLPLSIQEGYEFFLSAETVTFHQYQVFGHLKRLGYVVNRFDPRPTENLKRKLNVDFRECKKEKNTSAEETAVGHAQGYFSTNVIQYSHTDVRHPKTPRFFQDETGGFGTDSFRDPGRNWWTNVLCQPQPPSPQASVPCWNFSSIFLPDLGLNNSSCASLPPPDPSLLPGALQVPECHMASWQKKLNLKEERLPRQGCQRERDRNNPNFKKDEHVCCCTNWVEHMEQLKNRRRQQCREGPAYQWEKIHPLTQPRQHSSHCGLMKEFSIIQSSDLLQYMSRLPYSNKWRISFNVYQSNTVTEFKKSQPGKPYTRMCVCSFDGPAPDLFVMKQLSLQSMDVPVTFAVVDHGDVSFYCFKDIRLPIDVY